MGCALVLAKPGRKGCLKPKKGRLNKEHCVGICFPAPGESPAFTWDADGAAETSPVSTQTYVIAGGPCSGKTTVVKELQKRGHRVEPETAETIIMAGLVRTAES